MDIFAYTERTYTKFSYFKKTLVNKNINKVYCSSPLARNLGTWYFFSFTDSFTWFDLSAVF